MKITKIKIDGFRNIKDTTLEFTYNENGDVKDVPIIVLLAPNNRGKTNLLDGIQSSFGLIAKQGVQVADYIGDANNYANWNKKECGSTFSFEVEFLKAVDEMTYTYGFSFDYAPKEEDGEFVLRGAVSNEYLKSKSKDGVEKDIFYRVFEDNKIEEIIEDLMRKENLVIETSKYEEDHGKEHIVVLCDKNPSKDKNDNTIYKIPHVPRVGKKVYNSSLFLGIHKLGSVAMLAKRAGDCTEGLLRDITGVLVSLTREDIGTIIMREDKSSDFGKNINELDKLVEDAGRMRSFDEKNKLEDSGEWGFFRKEFQGLFPYYKSENDEEADIKIKEYEHSGRYQVLFKDSRKERPEFADTLSFGTRRVFKMLSQVISNKTPLFSVEGIENGLHPEVYIKLVDSLFRAVDNKTYQNETGSKSRVHDPRLIISSHAPGVVNKLKTRFKSIYVALENDGDVSFVVLTEKAIDSIKDIIYDSEGYYGLGDVIFKHLYNPLTSEKRREEWFK